MSREWDIDQEVQAICAKVMLGTATESDRQQMQHLSAERVRRMMANFPRRRR